jgi:hypothetical protein
MGYRTLKGLRRRNHRKRTKCRRSAAEEAIRKTGNWKRVLRERIESLRWGELTDSRQKRLCLGLAGDGRIGRAHDE